ncbi:hypothetical protein [Flavobacterium sp. HBTb2-11-1]|uniref:hypothetical protein n=1 Tax=Flavobacterium sp. HBTb2-11-1 TaxID=2692212 RepID=UPI001367F2CC|nr:hypothetical protein [Flavobacterium sp. HBTb2-11-1]MXO06703.1 hypothetical protein [Flavobacterium sp. HBTb2-11-1]
MKTKIILPALGAFLLCCCQKKDLMDSIENDSDPNSVQLSSIDSKTVKKWLSLDKEADSIMNSAQYLIQQQSEIVDSCPQDEREYMNTNIMEAQRHLDRFRNKVKYTRNFAIHIEEYNPSLESTLDSLKEDCIQEKYMLEKALGNFR